MIIILVIYEVYRTRALVRMYSGTFLMRILFLGKHTASLERRKIFQKWILLQWTYGSIASGSKYSKMWSYDQWKITWPTHNLFLTVDAVFSAWIVLLMPVVICLLRCSTVENDCFHLPMPQMSPNRIQCFPNEDVFLDVAIRSPSLSIASASRWCLIPDDSTRLHDNH